MKFLKRHAYALLFTLFLMGANVYSLLKVFVIPSAVSTVSANTTSSSTASSTASTSTGKVTKTDTTYKDDNMDIKITTGKTSDTTYYVADIKLSSADYLKTALAQNTYGTNITETTSSIAQQNNAIFAINGDYYGANQSGYVIKMVKSIVILIETVTTRTLPFTQMVASRPLRKAIQRLKNWLIQVW